LNVPGLLSTHFPEHGPFLGIYARVISGGVARVGSRVVPPADRGVMWWYVLAALMVVAAAVAAGTLL
jgi:hypothetical protein